MKVFTSRPGLSRRIHSSPSAMNKRNSVLHALLTCIRLPEEITHLIITRIIILAYLNTVLLFQFGELMYSLDKSKCD